MSVWHEEAKIFISVGETSGDLYASYLAKAIKEELPKAKLLGMGGHNMARAGITLVIYSSHKGAIGVIEALKVVPFFLFAYTRTKDFLFRNPPDVLILVDFGAFNLRLGKWARSRGIKVLYFIPPGSWRREVGGNIKNLSKAADKVICIFPWNQEALQREGIEAYFFGHPLLDLLEKVDKREARRVLCLNDTLTLGLLPGSRQQEIRYTLPVMLQTIPLLAEHFPSLQCVLAPPQNIMKYIKHYLPKGWRIIDDLLSNGKYRVYIRSGKSWSVINASDALIVTSGTATLEAAILETPFIVIYRGSSLTHLEYHLRGLKLPYISLPNIILGRMEFPELIQERANPAFLAEHTLRLLRDKDTRIKQFQLFKEIKNNLGEKGMFKKTAILLKEMVMQS